MLRLYHIHRRFGNLSINFQNKSFDFNHHSIIIMMHNLCKQNQLRLFDDGAPYVQVVFYYLIGK